MEKANTPEEEEALWREVIMKKSEVPCYADTTSKPGFVFIPNVEWLSRQIINFINNDKRARNVRIEELVNPPKQDDDWLKCSVWATHIANNPLECSKCFKLQCRTL